MRNYKKAKKSIELKHKIHFINGVTHDPLIYDGN